MIMEHITANAVVRHIGKSAGFVKNPHRLHVVEVEGAVDIDFTIGVKGNYTSVVGDWAVAFDENVGIITVTSAADGKRSIYYVHWLADRYKLAGWLHRRVG